LVVRLLRDPLRIGASEFLWGSRTYVMGIINVTPDSFSGDGLTGVHAAVGRARQMEQDGADLIDVGAESTRPETWAGPGLPESEELARLIPAIEAISSSVSVPVSADTYKAAVARRALGAGARIINDVFALRRDPEMAGALAEAEAPVILMHNGRLEDGPKLMDEIIAGLRQSLELASRAGIKSERIMIDPGIGFGKTVAHNLALLAATAELAAIGPPLLVGTSRKSFLGRLTGREVGERLAATVATNVLAFERGARIFRVHDVAAVRDALAVTAATVAAWRTPATSTTTQTTRNAAVPK
jgi:dihydropteroate synthase